MNDVTQYFPKVRTISEGFKAPCPKCLHKGETFSWNTSKGVGCCFNAACDFYYKRGGVRINRLLAFFNVSGVKIYVPEVIEASKEADLELPEGFKPIRDLPGRSKYQLIDYFESRGISKELVYRARVGYCNSGKMWGYIIFPVFDNGEVYWWQGRRFKDRTPKFYNPKSSHKSELVYRLDGAARKPKRIILVESIFNALTLSTPSHDNPQDDLVLGMLGKSLSDIQLDKILAYEKYCTKIIIALDPDAITDAADIAEKFEGIIPKVKIARFPEDQDVNSVGRKIAWELIDRAETYSSRNRMAFLNPDYHR